MKTALTALALIASATVTWAQDAGTSAAPEGIVSDSSETTVSFTIVDTDAVGNGQYEIVTLSDDEYSLWRANCVPMQLVLVDTDDDMEDLKWNKWQNNEVQLEDVFRGTAEHDIAAAACDS